MTFGAGLIAEGVGDPRDRLAEMCREFLAIGDVLGYFTQSVHVVDEDDEALRAIPGVVETGLFVGRCDVLIVASEAGVRRQIRG